MSLELVTAPAVEPVSLDEAKDHLRVTISDEDALIEGYIAAAREHLDGRDGILGRQLITATWDLTLDAFPCREFIRLPLPPVQSITSITYTDTNGAPQTLASSKYALSAERNRRPRVNLAYGETWPAARDHPDSVTVRFVAGYGVQRDVPWPIKAAMLLHVEHMYYNRGEVVVGASVQPLPGASMRLLSPFMVT